MIYQGIVTKIEVEYCKFILDGQITVYAGVLFASTNNIKFPAYKAQVTITDAKRHKLSMFLLPTSVIFANNYFQPDNNVCQPYLHIIWKLNLNFFDLLFIEDTVKNWSSISPEFLRRKHIEITTEEIIFKLITRFPRNEKFRSHLEKSYLAKFQLRSPKDHQLEIAERVATPFHWTFGVECNKQCLVGYLNVHPTFGFICLADQNYFIPCQIAPDNRAVYSLKLANLLNSLVMIQKYNIFTENFKHANIIHYVFANIKDIEVIKEKNISVKMDTSGSSSSRTASKYPITVNLKVIHRASVSTKPTGCECWVFCSIKSPKIGKSKDCFIVLNGPQFLKYPLFNTDDEYDVYSETYKFDRQMTNFNGDKTYNMNGIRYEVFYFPSDAKMTLKNAIINPVASAILNDFDLMTVSEAREALDENKVAIAAERKKDLYDVLKGKKRVVELVSFEAIVKERKTVPPKEPPNRAVTNTSFGMHGTEVHQIIFKAPEPPRTHERVEKHADATRQRLFYPDQNLTLAEILYRKNQEYVAPPPLSLPLYMHNWQQLQTPLGLVSDMKVAVRQVMLNASSAQYFKPTFITRIEPLEYLPERQFNSTPEFVNNVNWGPPTCLSASYSIPPNVVCWGPTYTITFNALKFQVVCPNCNDKYIPGQESCCEGGVAPLQMDLTYGLKCRDRSGDFDVFGTDENALKIILGLRDVQWDIFVKAFWGLKFWTINEKDWEEQRTKHHFIELSSAQQQFAKIIKVYIDYYNRLMVHRFDLKCRKFREDRNDTSGIPTKKFYLIQVRPSMKNRNL